MRTDEERTIRADIVYKTAHGHPELPDRELCYRIVDALDQLDAKNIILQQIEGRPLKSLTELWTDYERQKYIRPEGPDIPTTTDLKAKKADDDWTFVKGFLWGVFLCATGFIAYISATLVYD